MFLDEVKIFIASGKGGDGIVHFRREKYVPRGGPDGGNGGKGGDVVLVLEGKLNTLSTFRRKRHYRADPGRPGGRNNRQGRSGDDLEIYVPGGTIAFDEEEQRMLGELVPPTKRLIVCRGGRGGRGNARYATSRNQAPRMAEKGEPGEERWIKLELRLIADVGIIGVPNAGKSTLLAAVTNATPKIADYPFTTLEPNLGVAELDDDLTLVLADIPGLIEGAHQGAGLGAEFLRHISRTRALIHLVDGAGEEPLADHSQVNAELALYESALGEKPQVVAVNKMDLPQAKQAWPALESEFERRGIQALPVSGLTRQGVRELLFLAAQQAESVEAAVPDEVPRYMPEPDTIEFEIHRASDGAWQVEGQALERAAAMTYWEYDEAVRRFQGMLQKLGVNDALREAGIQDGDTVRIGEYELEWRE
jgi:GTP-binding protein